MTASYFILATFLSGCATSEDVKELTERVEKLEAAIGKGSAPAAGEAEAGKLLKEAKSLIGEQKIKEAKEKLATVKSKYPNTRSWQRGGASLERELSVFGKPAPSSLGEVTWLNKPSTEIDLSSGTTFIVFWEVWCPHCVREVPELQKTFEKYSGKGLQMVGLTKMSRGVTEEKVTSFLSSKSVSYPVAKEDGTISKHFAVGGIPAAAVVKDGKIVWRGHPARLTDKQLEEWL